MSSIALHSVGVLDDYPLSESPSSKTDGNSYQQNHALNLTEFSIRGASTIRSLRDFSDVLKHLKVGGPYPLTESLKTRDLIARGAQASVFTAYISELYPGDRISYFSKVAIKRSLVSLGPNECLDVNGTQLGTQFHDMYLEILSLCHHALRSHRNIARLIGWTTEISHSDLPLLVLEFAKFDLYTLIDGNSCTGTEQQHLCLDVARGLEALHTNGIIHGDLKPRNVLVRAARDGDRGTSYIAMLADFGFSILEAEANTEGQIAIKGYSPEWCAPEILASVASHLHANLSVLEYQKADIYSLGLIFWWIVKQRNVLRISTSGTDVAQIVAAEVMRNKELAPEFCVILHEAVCRLLSREPMERPSHPLLLLVNDSKACKTWEEACRVYDGQWSILSESGEDKDSEWELSSLQMYAMQPLSTTFKHQSSKLSASELFTMFLIESAIRTGELSTVTLESVPIQALILSSEKGFKPAQAVVHRVLTSYAISPPESCKILAWLHAGASTGCRIALEDLSELSGSNASKAEEQFRRDGALQLMYHTEEERKAWQQFKRYVIDSTSAGKDCILPHTTANGSMFEELSKESEWVRSSLSLRQNLELRDKKLLMLANTAGCTEMMLKLCKSSYSRSIQELGKILPYTCLHWLFNYPEDDMPRVVDSLLSTGIHIDALSAYTIISYHHPYRWPRGSPLHWSVTAGSVCATRALLEHGANPMIRNNCDPYSFDRNERFLENGGLLYQGLTSFPPDTTQGLTPVDMAVANFDWKVLQVLGQQQTVVDHINDADEEGYAAFHRLQHYMIGRTYSELPFCGRAFLGNEISRTSRKLSTIKILQQAGGNINQFTVKSELNETKSKGTYNPLMLACIAADIETVAALLLCGADVKARNSQGLGVLCFIPEQYEPHTELENVTAMVRILLDHGADPNAATTLTQEDTSSSLLIYSPLRAAIASGIPEVLHLLLAHGADKFAKFHHRRYGGLSVAATILSDVRYSWSALEARQNNDEEEQALAQILDKQILDSVGPANLKLLLEDVDDLGGSLLHYSVSNWHCRCTEVILSYGANPNIYRRYCPGGDRMEGTPLDCVLYDRLWLAKRKEEPDRVPLSKEYYMGTKGDLDSMEKMLLNHGGRFMRPQMLTKI